MPWEISIAPGEAGSNLGTKDEVVAWVEHVLPGVEFGAQPPFPPEVFASLFGNLEEATQRHLSQSKLEASFEDGDLSIDFYCDDEPEIRSIQGDVRGDGNPFPALAKICLPKGWRLFGPNGTPVDLSGDESQHWRTFCEWRDRCFGESVED